jgi:micrococcal nuclease
MNITSIRAYLIVLVTSLIASLPASGGAGPSAAKKAEYNGHENASIVTVKRVIDGDTFELTTGKHVRLQGIDTPEKGEPFADIATDFADSIFRGKAVRLEVDKKEPEDKYGRILGYVYVDRILFNELIIRRGLARVYLFRGNQPFRAELISAQNEARRAKIGIWSLPAPSPEPYYIAPGGSYRFHRPLCPLIKNINLKKAKRYKSRDGALDMGLSPCRECKP